MVRKEKRELLKKQALHEIQFARRHKEGKVSNWHLNEDMYFGKKEKTEDSRANVDLGRMQEHIHTLLSKIDSPLTFKFEKKKAAQLKRVRRLNSLKDYDSDRDNWDIKDIVAKKQCLLYGRAIFAYFASSDGGYMPHLENVDVYDFLVDPAAGGIDLEQGRYMGRWGVTKDRYDLKGNKVYIKDELDVLLRGDGNNTTRTQEETNKDNRTYALDYDSTQKEKDSEDKFKFWEWCTTFEGERYYLLMTESGICIRCEKLKDMFDSNLWPFWTYAAFPDLTEFWTTSYADYVREIFMAQSKTINQMLDNAEQINKPQKIVDVNAIQNLAQLKYRRGGNHIEVNGDAGKAVKFVETPSISTPINVFQQLESIQLQASGTANAAGTADTSGRATIYEGNVAQESDRFGLLNKSYSFGYKRFAKLWEHGVREHLTKKMAIDILGPDGVDVEIVGKGDLFRGKEDYAVMVESSNAELQNSEQKKRNLGAFFSSLLGTPLIKNQKKLIELLGTVAGAEQEQLRQLLDDSEFGDAEVMAEAERDIEIILDGTVPAPNRVANAAYKQRFVNYMQDHEEDIDQEQFARMVRYVQSLDEVIISNTRRQAREAAGRQLVGEEGQERQGQLRQPGPAQPLQDVIQQNVQR
jgi:hypothetical protein